VALKTGGDLKVMILHVQTFLKANIQLTRSLKNQLINFRETPQQIEILSKA